VAELMVDYITSLDGFGSAEGWPGLWGMGGPEYFAFLAEDAKQEYTLLMGARTYRLFAEFAETGAEDMSGMTERNKVVFSRSLREPLDWPNSTLVAGDGGDHNESAPRGRALESPAARHNLPPHRSGVAPLDLRIGAPFGSCANDDRSSVDHLTPNPMVSRSIHDSSFAGNPMATRSTLAPRVESSP